MRKGFDMTTVARRLWNSPITLICLIVVTAALGASTYAVRLMLRAPAIPNWSWSAHPNAVLVCFRRSGCGCGGDAAGTVMREGRLRGIDVLVVTDEQAAAVKDLVDEAEFTRAHLMTGVAVSTIRRLSPAGRTTLLRVRNGRIVGETAENLVPPGFMEGG